MCENCHTPTAIWCLNRYPLLPIHFFAADLISLPLRVPLRRSIFIAVHSPPRIIKQPPPDELLFQVAQAASENDKPFIVECEAEGEPAPRYVFINSRFAYPAVMRQWLWSIGGAEFIIEFDCVWGRICLFGWSRRRNYEETWLELVKKFHVPWLRIWLVARPGQQKWFANEVDSEWNKTEEIVFREWVKFWCGPFLPFSGPARSQLIYSGAFSNNCADGMKYFCLKCDENR